MRLTTGQLIAATGCMTKNADLLTASLNRAMEGAIDTRMRVAHFLAQTSFESAMFTHVEENLMYSAERLVVIFPRYFFLTPTARDTRNDARRYARKPADIANVVYANRMGNGPPASGDGYRFRGRGFLQITGRSNYVALNHDVPTIPSVTNPDALCGLEYAARSAAWYWNRFGCNVPADNNDVEAVTRRINGGINGLAERRVATLRAIAALA